jgi:hypothetical protein
LTGADIDRPGEFLIRIEYLKTIRLEMPLDSFEITKLVAEIRVRHPLPKQFQKDIETRYAVGEDDGKVGHFGSSSGEFD